MHSPVNYYMLIKYILKINKISKRIKVTWSHNGGTLTSRINVFLKRYIKELSPFPMWEYREDFVTYKPRTEPSPENESASTLILDFHISELLKNRYLLFNPPHLWYFFYGSLSRLRLFLNFQINGNTTVFLKWFLFEESDCNVSEVKIKFLASKSLRVTVKKITPIYTP
jgi:hypothetical protein